MESDYLGNARRLINREFRLRASQEDIDHDSKSFQRKLVRQLELVRDRRFRVVGYGPPSRGGWPNRGGYYYRCLNCGYIMASNFEECDTCFCGVMHLDTGMRRFGSELGDDSVEVLEEI